MRSTFPLRSSSVLKAQVFNKRAARTRFSRNAASCGHRDDLTIARGHTGLVMMAEGFHAYPSRTRPLSPLAPMVLGPQGPGRVGRCQAGCSIPKARRCWTDAGRVLGESNVAKPGVLIPSGLRDKMPIASKPGTIEVHAKCSGSSSEVRFTLWGNLRAFSSAG